MYRTLQWLHWSYSLLLHWLHTGSGYNRKWRLIIITFWLPVINSNFLVGTGNLKINSTEMRMSLCPVLVFLIGIFYIFMNLIMLWSNSQELKPVDLTWASLVENATTLSLNHVTSTENHVTVVTNQTMNGDLIDLQLLFLFVADGRSWFNLYLIFISSYIDRKYHMKYGLLFKLINTGIFSLQSSGRKKLRHPSLIQHYSQDLFSWRGQSAMTIPNGKTTFSLSVHRPFTSHSVLSSTYSVPNELLQKHHTVTKTHFHRFPFHHLFPPPGLDKPTTQTTCWANESSVTRLWVLAATQKPSPKNICSLYHISYVYIFLAIFIVVLH